MSSIQRRLTFQLLALVLVLGGVSDAIIYGFVRSHLLAEFDRGLSTRSQVVAGMALRADHNSIQYIATPSDLSQFSAGRPRASFQIWSGDHTVFARSPSLSTREMSYPPDATPANKAYEVLLPDGTAGRAMTIRWIPRLDLDERLIADADPPAPTLSATIAVSRAELDRTLTLLSSSILGGLATLGIGAVIAVGLTVRSGLRPLRRLATEADAIRADSLHQQFTQTGNPRELAPIVARLNSLLKRLDAAFARERRFSADVAHELRTPIAELRSLAEVSLRWPRQADHMCDRRDTLQIARRMQRLVAQLLAIARCEGGLQQVALESVDLSAPLLAAWDSASAFAHSRGVCIEWRLCSSPLVISDPIMLRSMLDNLLLNAATYATARTCIAASVDRNGAQIEISLRNSTMDLSSDNLAQMTQPFWRRDRSRTDNTHCGLGLALVRAYADTLNVAVELDLPEPQTFSVRVVLPCAQTPSAEELTGHG